MCYLGDSCAVGVAAAEPVVPATVWRPFGEKDNPTIHACTYAHRHTHMQGVAVAATVTTSNRSKISSSGDAGSSIDRSILAIIKITGKYNCSSYHWPIRCRSD